jgi:hypothetical protein
MPKTQNRQAAVSANLPVPRFSEYGQSNGLSAYDLVRDRLAAATGYTGREYAGRLSTRCPAHEDRQASLSVRRADDRVLVHCHAACRLDDILAELELTTRDLFDRTGKPWRKPWVPPRPEPDPGWTYVTEAPDDPFDSRRLAYLATTAHVPKGTHPGGPVAAW